MEVEQEEPEVEARFCEGESRFSEEEPLALSRADKDLFLELLDNPPKANEALKKLMKGK